MSVLKAFVLGIAATAVITYVFAAAVALVIAASGGSVEMTVGPLGFIEVTREQGESAIGLGPGLALLALGGGALNAGAGVLVRRARDRPHVP